MNQAFLDLARRYKQLKQDIKELDAQIKGMKQDAQAMNAALAEAMEDLGLESFAMDDATFFLRSTLRASVPVEDRAAFYAALRERAYGYLIQETIPANTLTAFVKEQIVDNGGALPPWMEGLVSVYTAAEVAARTKR